jgi:hypothetical protein
MATLGLPFVNVIFKSLGASAIPRRDRGVVALLIKDLVGPNFYEISNVSEIAALPMDDKGKKQIELALIGNQFAPKKVIVMQDRFTSDFSAGYTWLETVQWDYLAIPDYVDTTHWVALDTFLKKMRSNGRMIKAVVNNTLYPDSEYVVNFRTTNIVSGTKTYTTSEYCSRIAGLLAGTPLDSSVTYSVLPEVTGVRSYTKEQLSTAIGGGEFVIFNDGSKIKVARGVTSLKTTTADKGDSFKKIKIVEILDAIYSDITTAISDNYIGKYNNNYDNKVLLITAIQAYFRQLEIDQILDEGQNAVEIDLDAQRVYLQSKGINVANMTDQEIKEANTGDQVFIKGRIKPLDAMEEISIKLSI